MGGHGGLNILPQKKWNVYNRDNRTIVQRDQRLNRQRLQNQSQSLRNRITDSRLNNLRQQITQPNQQQQQSFLTGELQKITEQNCHVNLFEREERLIENQEVIQGRIMREMEFIKDKPMDMASKFLGSYGGEGERGKPWYLRSEKEREKQRQEQKRRKERKEEMVAVRKSGSVVTKEVFKKEMETGRERDGSRERSRDQRVKKEKMEVKIEKKEMSKMDQMRQERRKREEKQKLRSKELLLRHNAKQ